MANISTHLRSLVEDSSDRLSISGHSRKDIEQWLSYEWLNPSGSFI